MSDIEYVSIDRDELKRLQADSKRLEWFISGRCVVASMNGTGLPTVYRVEWPSEGFAQGEWYPTEYEAIDAAILAAQGDSHE